MIPLIGLGALLSRLPLWILPGPGRDEAAYHYWSHHPEASYAPLLQGLVRLGELVGLPPLVALRAPSALAGFALLWLVDVRLRAVGAERGARLFALATVALCPWQTYAGAVLHPDALLATAILGMVIATQRGHMLAMVVTAVLAAMAKPTGLVLLPIAWWMLGRLEIHAPARLWIARGVLAASFIALLLLLEPRQLLAMADFGRMDPALDLRVRLQAGAFALLFLAGPLLLGLGVLGGRQRWSALRAPASNTRRRDALVSLALAGLLLGLFAAAALLRGQIKANWILPAALLLLPWSLPSRARVWSGVGLAATIAASVALVVGLHQPERVRALESRLAPQAQSYAVHAGLREARVSSSRSWSHRLAEYASLEDFAASLSQAWANNVPKPGPIRWIIADDYGLATQLAWQWHEEFPRVVIPEDGIFHATRRPFANVGTDELVLILAVHSSSAMIWDRLELLAPLPAIAHPVTGDPIASAIARRAPRTQE